MIEAGDDLPMKMVDGELLPLTVDDMADLLQRQQDEVAIRWAEVRAARNALLASCDWTQLPDAPVNPTVWAEYRQALRDVTAQSDPLAISWPARPTH